MAIVDLLCLFLLHCWYLICLIVAKCLGAINYVYKDTAGGLFLDLHHSGIHSSKKGKMAAQRTQREGKGFGWQKRKAVDKAKKFKKWKSVADTRQFSR